MLCLWTAVIPELGRYTYTSHKYPAKKRKKKIVNCKHSRTIFFGADSIFRLRQENISFSGFVTFITFIENFEKCSSKYKLLLN